MTDGHEHLEEWIQRYLDGDLDEVAQKRLAEVLAESADARALLASHMRLSGGMLQLAKAGCLGRKPDENLRSAALNRNRSASVRLGPWIAAAAALVAVAIGIALYSPARERPVIGVLEDVSAQGAYIERDGRRMAAVSRMQIHLGDKLITTTEAGLVVRYRDEQTQVVLHDETEATFEEVEGAKRIDLAEGMLLCDVAPQPDGRPMVLRTAGALAEVLGTRFLIGADGKQTHVAVNEGRVRLIDARRPGRSVVAADGESAQADAEGVKKKSTKDSIDDRNVVHGFELFDAV
ncbi:MAG: FecR family protein, partial [Phycisphaeraceae bacterium]|nr:FecR family protein [Phycisphaeraceae bacterium]